MFASCLYLSTSHQVLIEKLAVCSDPSSANDSDS